VIDVTHEGRKRKRENAKEVVEIGSSQENVRQEPEHVTADETGKGDHAQKEGDNVDPALQDKRKIGVDEEKALASYSEFYNSSQLETDQSLSNLFLRARTTRHYSMVCLVYSKNPH